MKQKFPKTLILVRHAHRDTGKGRELDNGLSPKGRKQARRIEKIFMEDFGKRSRPVLLSSPKQRCLETLEPIALATKAAIKIDPLLNEGGDVRAHVASFLAAWERSSELLTFGSSHGDWIPEIIRQVCGSGFELKKGGWLEIRSEDGEPRIHRLLQEP